MLAVIRIRGKVKTPEKIERTLKMLKLDKANRCTILQKTNSFLGMLRKAKDYITWGEIEKETLIKILKKRLRLIGNKKVNEEFLKEKIGMGYEELADALLKGKNLKEFKIFECFFRLRPPSKGFKSIKKPWPKGDLGYRGIEINKLLKRMI